MQYDVAHKKMDQKINAKYTLEGTVPKNVDKIQYVGVTVTEDLRWTTHVSNICTKINRTLDFFSRNLYPCPLSPRRKVDDCNNRNLFLTAKLLKQGYRYHKIRKAFSKFYHRLSELIVKYNIGLKLFCYRTYWSQ